MARRHQSHSHPVPFRDRHEAAKPPRQPDWRLEAGTVPCTVLAAVDWLPPVCVGVGRTHSKSITRQACQIKMRMIDLAREPGATLTRNSLQGGRGGEEERRRSPAQMERTGPDREGGPPHTADTADNLGSLISSCRPSASCGPSKSLAILCHHEASLTNMAA